MARGDIQISLETNDLKIEKSSNNIYATNSFRTDELVDVVVVSIVIPKEYSDGFTSNDSFDWRNYTPATKDLEKIDDPLHHSKVVHLEYVYIDSNGLNIPIAEHSLVTYGSGNTVKFLTALEYNELIDEAILADNDFVFGYAMQVIENVTYELFSIKALTLGDFVIEDHIPQNEYILLNAKEGSFLQVPLQGVGLGNFLQSPSTSQELIDTVIEKFAQDTLRVIGIVKNDDNLTIETEDYNKKT